MTVLTRAERAQIEQFLADAVADYPVPGEHYAYLSTLMAHVQADFSQMLAELPLGEPTEADFQSSCLRIIVEVLRREDPFEQTLEERALAILRALRLGAPTELSASGLRAEQAATALAAEIMALPVRDPFEQVPEERALLRAEPEQDWSQCRTRWDEESA